jgi:hypothetical protein
LILVATLSLLNYSGSTVYYYYWMPIYIYGGI